MQIPEPPPGTPPPPFGTPNPADSVRWSAVAIGVAVDWISTIVATMVVFSIAGGIAESRGTRQGDAEAYIEQLQNSPDFIMLFSLVGLLCVSFGAYIGARRAGHGEMRHASLVGVGSITLGLLMESLTSGQPEVGWNPVWFHVLGYMLTIPFAMLGGLFAERTRPRDPSEPL